jgi:FKBP-type peptidyl-prolyl cis-trans isomerase
MNQKKSLTVAVVLAVLLIAVAVYFINNKKSISMTDTNTTSGTSTNSMPERVLEPIKPAEVGDLVVVNYTGTLENGTKFDSSYDRGEPFVFIIGRGMVIKGWDEGLLGAKRGDKKHLVITPDKGYGTQEIKDAEGKVLIPKNSTLVFDLEIVEIVAKEKVDKLVKEQVAAKAVKVETGASMKK